MLLKELAKDQVCQNLAKIMELAVLRLSALFFFFFFFTNSTFPTIPPTTDLIPSH